MGDATALAWALEIQLGEHKSAVCPVMLRPLSEALFLQ